MHNITPTKEIHDELKALRDRRSSARQEDSTTSTKQPDVAELRAIAAQAKLEDHAARSKARDARIRYDDAERAAAAACDKAGDAHQALRRALWEQGVLTDVFGNEGDKRVWCVGAEGDCMGDCGGRFHDKDVDWSRPSWRAVDCDGTFHDAIPF